MIRLITPQIYLHASDFIITTQIVPIEGSKLKLQHTFRAPVYVTQDRRNAMGVGLVFEADLATYEHVSHWTLQGVALMLNTDA